jgi:cation transport ATPase
VEQGSGHLLARVFVSWAEAQGAAAPMARELHEDAGRGVRGLVNGREVAVGSSGFVGDTLPPLRERIARFDVARTGLRAYVASSCMVVLRSKVSAQAMIPNNTASGIDTFPNVIKSAMA